MSVEYDTYLGPYLEARVGRRETSEEILTCSDARCPKFATRLYAHDAKFCQSCGAPIRFRAIPTQADAVDADELRQAMGDVLTPATGDGIRALMREQGVHVWLANLLPAAQYRRYRLDARRVETIVPIAATTRDEEIAVFEQFFAASIALLREAYGAANVVTRWGLVHQIR